MEDQPISPISLKSHTRLLLNLSGPELKKKWGDTGDFNIENYLNDLQTISLYECMDTGLHFFFPKSLAGDAQFYKALSKQNWYYPEKRWDMDTGFELLKNSPSLLEIGCGNGSFLERFTVTASIAQSGLHGLELNPDSAKSAQLRGLNVSTQPLSEFADQHAGEFDSVCAFQVLEHVPDIHEFITSACRLLRPNGRLLFAVPNRDCHLDLNSNPLDYPPHHMSRWSKSVFASLPLYFPLSIVAIRTQPLVEIEFDRFLTSTNWHFPLLHYALNIRGSRRLGRFMLKLGIRHFFLGQSLLALYTKKL